MRKQFSIGGVKKQTTASFMWIILLSRSLYKLERDTISPFSFVIRKTLLISFIHISFMWVIKTNGLSEN